MYYMHVGLFYPSYSGRGKVRVLGAIRKGVLSGWRLLYVEACVIAL